MNDDIHQYEKDKKAALDFKASLALEKQKLVTLKENLANQAEQVKEDLNSLQDEIKKANASLASLTSKQNEQSNESSISLQNLRFELFVESTHS